MVIYSAILQMLQSPHKHLLAPESSIKD